MGISAKKIKVLFVGSFKDKAKDGHVGGQMYASRSLIQSQLHESIDWILLDTTGQSVPPPPLYVRLFFALKRIVKFIFIIVTKQPGSVLIFTANIPSIYEKGGMALIASFFRVKVILAPRGGPIDREIEKMPFLKKFVVFVLKRTNFIVCQGEYWKTFFSALVPKEQKDKFILIQNWIDIKQYNLSKIQKAEKNTDFIHVLFMGWIQEDKGVYDLFNAINNISHIDRKVKFFFLGDGTAKSDLANKCNSLKGKFEFSFTGWVYGDEKLNYLAFSDIFVLPSHCEGLPNSLIEAMACGMASIATNVGSVSDVIINNETGILVEPHDVKGLASALFTLINNDELRQRLSINGQNKIVANHSIESAVSKFKKIL